MQYGFGRGRGRRGRPKFDARDPRGIAICDGCGFLVQHSELREQKDYRGGATPVGLGYYVCKSCYDVPQPYFRRQLLRPDPVPLQHPRPDSNPTYAILAEDSDYLISEDGEYIVTEYEIGG